MRWAGERSVGYTKGVKGNTYRPWWNNEIKQTRKERKEANKKRRKLENRNKTGVALDSQEWKKAIGEYNKKKIKAQRKINEAIMKEEDRKLEEIQRKKSEKEWWGFLNGPTELVQEQTNELRILGKISKDETEQRIFIKEYWENIGKIKNKGGCKKQKIKMRRKQIEIEQTYEITELEIKKIY